MENFVESNLTSKNVLHSKSDCNNHSPSTSTNFENQNENSSWLGDKFVQSVSLMNNPDQFPLCEKNISSNDSSVLPLNSYETLNRDSVTPGGLDDYSYFDLLKEYSSPMEPANTQNVLHELRQIEETNEVNEILRNFEHENRMDKPLEESVASSLMDLEKKDDFLRKIRRLEESNELGNYLQSLESKFPEEFILPPPEFQKTNNISQEIRQIEETSELHRFIQNRKQGETKLNNSIGMVDKLVTLPLEPQDSDNIQEKRRLIYLDFLKNRESEREKQYNSSKTLDVSITEPINTDFIIKDIRQTQGTCMLSENFGNVSIQGINQNKLMTLTSEPLITDVDLPETRQVNETSELQEFIGNRGEAEKIRRSPIGGARGKNCESERRNMKYNKLKFPAIFPLKTLEDFYEFENSKSQEEYNCLVSLLKTIEEANVHVAIFEMVKICFSMRCAVHLNWKYYGNTIGISDSRLVKAFSEAVKESGFYQTASDNDIRKGVTAALKSIKQAKNRLNYIRKKPDGKK